MYICSIWGNPYTYVHHVSYVRIILSVISDVSFYEKNCAQASRSFWAMFTV